MADSKRLLADALTGLMECKPLDQVRVAEIASAAGVSKQTFYHHFSDKYHLMECCFRDMFAAPFKRMGRLRPSTSAISSSSSCAISARRFCATPLPPRT